MKDDVDEDDSGISSSGSTSVSESTILYGNARASRNMAEKHRRDNLNANISTMATLVPHVVKSDKRLDKISILRLATTYLRTQYTLGSGSKNFLSTLFNDQFNLEQFTVNHLVNNEGFLLIMTGTGKIVHVSPEVEQHLGYGQNDMLGQSLYNFIHPGDHDELTRNLTPDGMQPMSAPSPTGVARVSELAHDNNSSSSEESTKSHQTNKRTKLFREQRREFKIRIGQQTKSKRDHTPYESFDVSGLLRLAAACKNAGTNGNKGRRGAETTSTSNDIIFTCIATLPNKRSITEFSIMDANKSEYVTRHLLDGRIIYCDHRVSVVAGYMSEDISGLNAFYFMHKEDYNWPIIGLKQMYDRTETCGSSCYRLYTKTGEFIYLRTFGYLEYDKETKTVESFVCVNTLVSEEEGIQLIKEMKERFSATVSASSKGPTWGADTNSPKNSIELESTSQSSNPRSNLEDQAVLDRVIAELISDLSPTVSRERFFALPQYRLNGCIQNKGKVTPKQESEHTIGKFINPSSAEQSPISDSESAMPSGKPLSMFGTMNAVHNSHGNTAVMSARLKILAARKPNESPRVSHDQTSRLDVSQSANVLNAQKRIDHHNVGMPSPGALHEGTVCNIKVERDIEEFNCLEKEESVLQYLDDSASDSSIVSSGNEMHNRYPLKRICSDENLAVMRSKKRPNDGYTTMNTINAQRVPYVKCRPFATEYPDEFSSYNDVNSQPLSMTESPNSSLSEVGTDYQQLVDPVSLVITNPDEEQFVNLQNLKADTLRSLELNKPEFDCLRANGHVGFENLIEAEMQRPFNEQVVHDGLNRTHYHLGNDIMLRDSQMNALACNLQNPAFRAQRRKLSKCQTESNMLKQSFKTLQQDRHKYKLGI